MLRDITDVQNSGFAINSCSVSLPLDVTFTVGSDVTIWRLGAELIT